MRSIFLVGVAVAALLFAVPAQARNLNFIAESWQTFLVECQKALEDPQSYLGTLPEANPDGSLVYTTSPDGKALSIHLQKGEGYIEAFIDTFSDRESRHCAYYAGFTPSWDTAQTATQYLSWLRQNAQLEIIGGLSPLYGYPHYRISVNGMWPRYDLPVQTNIHENEFQLLITRNVTR